MKIERISDTKFSCSISGEELQRLNLSLNDLSYGSSSVRKLFIDIMKKAKEEINFEPEELPLMIEAIPTRDDGLLLQFSYVNDADELDNRFSQFAPFLHSESLANAGSEGVTDPFSNTDSADDILNCLQSEPKNQEKEPVTDEEKTEEVPPKTPDVETSMSVFVNGKDVTNIPNSKEFVQSLLGSIVPNNKKEGEGSLSFMDFLHKFQQMSKDNEPKDEELKVTSSDSDNTNAKKKEHDNDLCIMFSFASFDTLVKACHVVGAYAGNSCLYKHGDTPKYHLAIYSRGVSAKDFNKICNHLSEYGKLQKDHTDLLVLTMEEQGECLIPENAINKIAEFRI